MRVLMAAAAYALFLAACGIKGPLYLPPVDPAPAGAAPAETVPVDTLPAGATPGDSSTSNNEPE
ncbi:MAG: lipoprotein [Azoarcus sp.]|jgi:predicted small lipoprotein YifL|nr:lipoprotein [Azoarcus sp.]